MDTVAHERATKKQQELLSFIDGFIQQHGYGPSYREVMRALDYKSVSTVAAHVNGLLAKGYIEKTSTSARSLKIVARTESDSAHHVWLRNELLQLREAALDKGEAGEQDTDAVERVAELLGIKLDSSK